MWLGICVHLGCPIGYKLVIFADTFGTICLHYRNDWTFPFWKSYQFNYSLSLQMAEFQSTFPGLHIPLGSTELWSGLWVCVDFSFETLHIFKLLLNNEFCLSQIHSDPLNEWIWWVFVQSSLILLNQSHPVKLGSFSSTTWRLKLFCLVVHHK